MGNSMEEPWRSRENVTLARSKRYAPPVEWLVQNGLLQEWK
jgi:hypothetical protein